MRYISGIVGGVIFCQVLYLALFCDKALTGETWHSAEFLFHSRGQLLKESICSIGANSFM